MIITDISHIHQYQTTRLSWENIVPRKTHYLAYQVSGRYDHTVQGHTYAAAKDTLLFINQEDSYTVKCYEKGYSLCVSFCAETNLPTRIWDARDNPTIYNLFLRLMHIKNLSNKHNYYLAFSILYEIFSIVSKEAQTPSPHYSPADNVAFAVDYIAEHLDDEELKTAKLAKLCGISEKYFRTLFKRHYNVTPTQYIIELRLNTAVKLLRLGGFTVTEIASMIGIPDVYYFSKLFKKRFGLSPTKFNAHIE